MRTYTLTQAAYGQPAGTSLALDQTDPLVQLNVETGVLVEGKDAPTKTPQMTCPICGETMKRPPRFDNPEELSDHYSDRHAGFVVPDWNPDQETEE
jgi:hypothetical protein